MAVDCAYIPGWVVPVILTEDREGERKREKKLQSKCDREYQRHCESRWEENTRKYLWSSRCWWIGGLWFAAQGDVGTWKFDIYNKRCREREGEREGEGKQGMCVTGIQTIREVGWLGLSFS